MTAQPALRQLDGTTVIIQDDNLTALELEIELRELGAFVHTIGATRHMIDLMWAVRPLAVIMDPARDPAGAAFASVIAREVEAEFIQYADDGVGQDDGIRVSRSSGASVVVEAVIAAAWGGKLEPALGASAPEVGVEV